METMASQRTQQEALHNDRSILLKSSAGMELSLFPDGDINEFRDESSCSTPSGRAINPA
jgi:hypothetical protein